MTSRLDLPYGSGSKLADGEPRARGDADGLGAGSETVAATLGVEVGSGALVEMPGEGAGEVDGVDAHEAARMTRKIAPRARARP